MDLAKQGDPSAIAALINRSLASKGIHAEAELEFECLKISLQAAQIPNQKAVVTIIHRGMIVLQVENIKRVKILTYRSDNHYLAWQYEIELGTSLGDLSNESKQSLAMPHNPQDHEKDMPQDQNINLVSNPKGVILVKKLSQIQQNLQEYQDIIVRFTDEQVGTVRCLTTLTELIQVISRPSFLFAAVASNPNLRSLLDTIAESSQTNEHGDQVITNLSILQPGQQWQKAKIRLVSKIFLEPDELIQDQEVAQDLHRGITLDLENQDLRSEAIAAMISDHGSKLVETVIDRDLEDLIVNNEPEPTPETITSSSLFDDFSEPIVETITSSSLFDGFPEPIETNSQLFQSLQVVNDITEIPDMSDSLFDDFMSEGSPSDETVLAGDIGNDLFGNFSPAPTVVSRVDDSEIAGDINVIRSRIPKQNLDNLLQLMAEEDQSKLETQKIENNFKPIEKTIEKSNGISRKPESLESILSNMETITLSGLGVKPSPDFVTLDDFSQELDSIGF
jgi:hypothetical protein